jgi:hypothetical protein
MFVEVTAPRRYYPKRVDTFSNNDIKARIGETGPLLFKLPQRLSQLFHAPSPSYAFAFCSFSAIY